MSVEEARAGEGAGRSQDPPWLGLRELKHTLVAMALLHVTRTWTLIFHLSTILKWACIRNLWCAILENC